MDYTPLFIFTRKTMKILILTGLCLSLVFNSMGQSTKPVLPDSIVMACELSSKEQVKRMKELHETIFKKISSTVEHEDNYELIFTNTTNDFVMEVAEFIQFERLCCPWLKFQLTFLPKKGNISLKMGDSRQAKDMAKLVMGFDKK